MAGRRGAQLARHAKTGKLVSTKSKTGDPACSRAMSAWKTTGMTPQVAQVLGRCRAMARHHKQADLHRVGGHEARAQHLEHRVLSGKPLTAKDRLARARELAEQRRSRRSSPSPRATAEAHRAAKGDRETRMRSLANRLGARVKTTADRARSQPGDVHAFGRWTQTVQRKKAIEKQLPPRTSGTAVKPEASRDAGVRGRLNTADLRSRSLQAAKALAGRLSLRKTAAEHRAKKPPEHDRLEEIYRKSLPLREKAVGTPRHEQLKALAKRIALKIGPRANKLEWAHRSEMEAKARAAKEGAKKSEDRSRVDALDFAHQITGRYASVATPEQHRTARDTLNSDWTLGARHRHVGPSFEELERKLQAGNVGKNSTKEILAKAAEAKGRGEEPIPSFTSLPRERGLGKGYVAMSEQDRQASFDHASPEKPKRLPYDVWKKYKERLKNEELPDVTFARDAMSQADNHSIVLVDVKKVDEAWDKAQRIGVGGSDAIKDDDGSRYQKFSDFYMHATHSGHPIEMSSIVANENGRVRFRNGRHRFAFLRDQGVAKLHMAVPLEYVEDVRRHFAHPDDPEMRRRARKLANASKRQEAQTRA